MSEGVTKGQRELLGNCEWCGLPAYERVVLGKGRKGVHKGKAIQKMPQTALVCDLHAEHFEAFGAKTMH